MENDNKKVGWVAQQNIFSLLKFYQSTIYVKSMAWDLNTNWNFHANYLQWLKKVVQCLFVGSSHLAEISTRNAYGSVLNHFTEK
jgi:hypothetical protein